MSIICHVIYAVTNGAVSVYLDGHKMLNQITMNIFLSKDEIKRLYDYMMEHQDSQYFNVIQDNNSGIGRNTYIEVRYQPNTSSDITDYTNW